MTAEEKAKIDSMCFEDMLRRVRFDPIDSRFLDIETEAGRYAWEKWTQLCQATPREERVAASKSLGWGP